ncbi:predicted protein [Lichtheimia corymbifera JMRC:FSU:9682]|uniref:GATA-type domain-containing protein n=1 Tax=Lichtheimia corymbifera JMRC:FSU:9682 TaxID=1263082 RepID=A0A068RKC3_9FUNG|nr:predicted protein [Lichtheimia corymbifera JMRC:FSU:9682]
MELGRPVLPPITSIEHHNPSFSAPSTWSAPLEPRALGEHPLPFYDQQSRRLLPPQPKLAPSPYSQQHENPRIAAARKRMEQDMNQVMNHCNTMRETIQQQQAMIDTYNQQPWLEDMISRANEVLNALLRLQKQQMAAQEEQRQVHFYNTPYAPPGFYNCMPTENSAMHHDDNDYMSGGGRIRRKRRQRPTFQGRCHSCNISETPEWRRGPDGARTLCNACGLHYAKLERKRAAAEAKAKTEEQANNGTATTTTTHSMQSISSPTSTNSTATQDDCVLTP